MALTAFSASSGRITKVARALRPPRFWQAMLCTSSARWRPDSASWPIPIQAKRSRVQAAPDAADQAGALQLVAQVGQQGVALAEAVLAVPQAEAVQVHRDQQGAAARRGGLQHAAHVAGEGAGLEEAGELVGVGLAVHAQQGAEPPEEGRGHQPHQRTEGGGGEHARGAAQHEADGGEQGLGGAEHRLGLGHPDRAAGRDREQGHGDHVADHRRADDRGVVAAGHQERHHAVGQGEGDERVGEPDEGRLTAQRASAGRVVEGGQQEQVQHDRHQQGDVLDRRQGRLPERPRPR